MVVDALSGRELKSSAPVSCACNVLYSEVRKPRMHTVSNRRNGMDVSSLRYLSSLAVLFMCLANGMVSAEFRHNLLINYLRLFFRVRSS